MGIISLRWASPSPPPSGEGLLFWSPRIERSKGQLEHSSIPQHLYMMAKVTVWYDGGCPLCDIEISLMRRLDTGRRIDFINVSEEGGICPVDRQTLLARLHANENGVLLSGAAAFAAMWRAIPLLRPLGLLAKSPPILKILEYAYAKFLKARPTLQRLAGGRSVR